MEILVEVAWFLVRFSIQDVGEVKSRAFIDSEVEEVYS